MESRTGPLFIPVYTVTRYHFFSTLKDLFSSLCWWSNFSISVEVSLSYVGPMDQIDPFQSQEFL